MTVIVELLFGQIDSQSKTIGAAFNIDLHMISS